jgi:hypothetical protein
MSVRAHPSHEFIEPKSKYIVTGEVVRGTPARTDVGVPIVYGTTLVPIGLSTGRRQCIGIIRFPIASPKPPLCLVKPTLDEVTARPDPRIKEVSRPVADSAAAPASQCNRE